MIEFEVKAAAPEGADDVARRLEAQGARSLGEERHEDRYYSHPVRDFGVTDEALRVRSVESGGGRRVEMTYKGPKLDSRTKTRRELTLLVAEGETHDVLEALGFHLAARVSKRRRLYETGGFEIAVDEVDGLGAYVEAEAVLAEGADTSGLADRAQTLLTGLGCGVFERRSYLELLRSSGR